MCRPMYICTGFTTCICPAFYAAILLINILYIVCTKCHSKHFFQPWETFTSIMVFPRFFLFKIGACMGQTGKAHNVAYYDGHRITAVTTEL